jgi:hypothetical protein
VRSNRSGCRSSRGDRRGGWGLHRWWRRLGRNHNTFSEAGPITDRWTDVERQRYRQGRDTENEYHQYAEGDQERPTARVGFLGEEVSIPDGCIEVAVVRRCTVRALLAVCAVIDRHNRVRRSGAGILGVRQRGGRPVEERRVRGRQRRTASQRRVRLGGRADGQRSRGVELSLDHPDVNTAGAHHEQALWTWL